MNAPHHKVWIPLQPFKPATFTSNEPENKIVGKMKHRHCLADSSESMVQHRINLLLAWAGSTQSLQTSQSSLISK
jgi:hypothetical protein